MRSSFLEPKHLFGPVAIYAPEVSGTPTTDCLIYHKNRSNEDLAYVKQLLSDRRLTYTQLQYGSYSQDDFRQALSSVRFCIIIDNTESQGIAIGEMMAAGKPLFVWDQPVWDHMGEQYKIDATTVPYWDDMCGEKLLNVLNLVTCSISFCQSAHHIHQRNTSTGNCLLKKLSRLF